MEMKSEKCDCMFQFSIDDVLNSISPKYHGLLHLFVHQYDAHTQFWHGVAEINCTHEEIAHVQENGKFSDFCVTVFLSDGRVGMSRLLNSHYIQDSQSTHTRVAIVGWTALELLATKMTDE